MTRINEDLCILAHRVLKEYQFRNNCGNLGTALNALLLEYAEKEKSNEARK
jgi:hypothetical protein